MDFEFKALLRAALEQLPPDLPKFSIGPAEIEVTSPPAYVAQPLTSNLAFVLAKDCSASAGDGMLAPQPLAEALFAALPASAAEFFMLEIAGGGFINAAPTPNLIKKFVQNLFSASGELLYHEAPFVVQGKESRTTIQPDEMPRWQSVSHLVEKQRRRNEDLEQLMSNRNEDFSSDDTLMALALLADPELEADHYLSALRSSQNIPWLFRFFSRSAGAVIKKTVPPFEPEDLLYAEEAGSGRAAAELRERILRFRAKYFLAARLRRPEILLGALLGVVRSWMNLYNRPQIRALIGPKGRDAEIRPLFLVLTKISLEIVSVGLARLPLDRF